MNRLLARASSANRRRMRALETNKNRARAISDNRDVKIQRRDGNENVD